MGTVLTIPIQKGRIVKEPFPLVVFNPIPGVCMTCMEMLQNGAVIGFPKNMSLQRRILEALKQELLELKQRYEVQQKALAVLEQRVRQVEDQPAAPQPKRLAKSPADMGVTLQKAMKG